MPASDPLHASRGVAHWTPANLFVDTDPTVQARDGDQGRPVADAARLEELARGRGRGLVVPVSAPRASAGSQALVAGHPRAGGAGVLARRPRGSVRLRARGARWVRSAEFAAQLAVARFAARRHGALLVVTALLALLIGVGVLGVVVRGLSSARDDAREQREATAAELERARRRLRVITAQRDRAVGAARTADRPRDTPAVKVRARSSGGRASRRRPQSTRRHRRHAR